MNELVEQLHQEMSLIKGIDLRPLFNTDSSELNGSYKKMTFSLWCGDEGHVSLCYWDRSYEYLNEQHQKDRLELFEKISQILTLPYACNFVLTNRSSILKHLPTAYIWEWDSDPKTWCRFRLIDKKLQMRGMVGEIRNFQGF